MDTLEQPVAKPAPSPATGWSPVRPATGQEAKGVVSVGTEGSVRPTRAGTAASRPSPHTDAHRSDAHQPELGAAARLELVRFVAERLAVTDDLAGALAAVDLVTREALGVGAVTVGIVEEANKTMTTLIATGFSMDTQEMLSRPVELDESVPAATVWQTGEPIFWSSLDERDREYPRFAGTPSEHQAWAVLPLVVSGSVVGVLSIGWRDRRTFSDIDAALLALVAQQCAIAVDRARLLQVERQERETLELLAEGTRLMVSALDPAVVVRRLVRLAVPRLAPWCAVYVAERDGLHRVAVDVLDNRELAAELYQARTIPTDSTSPLAVSVRTGETVVVPVVTSDMVRMIYDESHIARMPKLDGARSWTGLVVPVKALGSVIGAMSLVSPEWGGQPPKEVQYAAEGLAGRAGVALSNARRFEHERLVAALLTDALLPSELPSVPGYDVKARYLPWGGPVAGDWFDVWRLPAGDYLIGIGDTAGHGIRPASLMAQLRNSARGLAVSGNGPGEILHSLGLLTIEDDPESLATAAYGILDTESGTFRWASAGHIGPIFCGAHGARHLPTATRPPLGVPVGEPPAEQQIPLARGETIVLVTDGVVERRGRDLGARLEELRALVEASASAPASTIAEQIVGTFCGPPEDDCCVVVVKRV
jgi:GAF domain-containing protein